MATRLTLPTKTVLIHYGVVCCIVGALFYLNQTNFILFHSLTEVINVIIACDIFLLVWNSRQFLDNRYFLFLGIGYGYVAFFDLLHALTYRMGIVGLGVPMNMATQLWLSARFCEALSLLIAPAFLKRPLKVYAAVAWFTVACSVIFGGIFLVPFFPVTFTRAGGFTPFAYGSEYLFVVLFAGGFWRLTRHRQEFDGYVFMMMRRALMMAFVSGIFFAMHHNPGSRVYFLAHTLKLFSFYCLYRAVIQTGLKYPYQLLFRNLKQSEEALRKERDRAQRYLDVALVMIVVIDRAGRIILINKKGSQILGYEEPDIIGKSWFDNFCPQRERAKRHHFFQQLIAGEKEPKDYSEGYVVTRSGAERIIAWKTTVLRDDEGGIVATLNSGDDITEQKMAQQALALSEEKFRGLVDNALVGIYTTDLSGKWLYGNQALADIFGFSSFIEMASESVWARYSDAAIRITMINALKERGRLTNYEIDMLTKGMETVTVLLSATLRDDRLSGMIMDITQLKKAADVLRRDKETFEKIVNEKTLELMQVQKELNNAKRLSDIGVLAATVAHELRNPLGVIRTATFNIRKKVPFPVIDSHLANIEKKIIEADKIIGGLLAYARLRMPSLTSVRVRTIIDESIADAEDKFQGWHVVINTLYDVDADYSVEADPSQLKEVFENILNNAFESFIQREGTIDVRVSALPATHELQICFADNGSGIALEDLQHISKPFFTRKSKGTGLGLAVAYQIVHLHGGRIEVTSTLNVGTTFSVVLPQPQGHTAP